MTDVKPIPERLPVDDEIIFIDRAQSGIYAKVVKDSIFDTRLTTLEVRLPRPYLAEFNTHGRLNSNTASSRAIPFATLLDIVELDPYVPSELGSEKRGMSPGALLDDTDYLDARDAILTLRDQAIKTAKYLAELGVHKSKVNRYLEPWCYSTIVVTATEWENFLNLRMDSGADIEMQRVARCIWECLKLSNPLGLLPGEWHLPYVGEEELPLITADGFDPVAVSVARCGRVSTLNQGRVRAYGLDEQWHNRGQSQGHWSPFQHQAMAISEIIPGLSGNLTGHWSMYRKMQPGEEVFHGVSSS